MGDFVPYSSRSAAGRELAEALSEYKGQNAVVVALPRGGIPLGVEVARALECPMDLILVRKIGTPGQPELAMGAIVGAKPPIVIINEEVQRFFRVGAGYLKAQEDQALAEIERRRALWGAGEAEEGHSGKIVIVVDDGLATGTSAEAAVAALRQEAPKMIVLAVPVASQESVDRLRGQVDRVVCLHTPNNFFGVGAFYRDFHQLSDAEVAAYLRESRSDGS